MTLTFATTLIPVVKANATPITKSISQFVTSLSKNKFFQTGIGVTTIGAGTAFGLSSVNDAAKDITEPLGIPSGYLVIGIIAVVLILLLKGGK